jgi:geranylgeranyl pyrophosphate synthase
MGAMQHKIRSLESVRDLVDEALENLVLERLSSTGEGPAMMLARDVLLAGGKRYRPILTLLAFEATGGTDLEKIVDLAVAAELIHTATLVHDDINDQSRTRRGRPAVHATHGISHGVIAGDYLFVLAFERCGGYEARIVERVAAACIQVASGELLQLKHIGDLTTTASSMAKPQARLPPFAPALRSTLAPRRTTSNQWSLTEKSSVEPSSSSTTCSI